MENILQTFAMDLLIGFGIGLSLYMLLHTSPEDTSKFKYCLYLLGWTVAIICALLRLKVI